MSTILLDQAAETSTAARHKNLREYRKLLSPLSPTADDVAGLLAVGRELGFDLDRAPRDQEAVRLAEKLERHADDIADSTNALEAAAGAAGKHGAAMKKKIDHLRGRQAELDGAVLSARTRAQRAANAARQLAELRAEHEDLFVDIPDEAEAAERRRLEHLAGTLPDLRKEFDTAEADLAAAELVFDESNHENERTPRHAKNKTAVVESRCAAMRARESIAGRIAGLHKRIHAAESARRRLAAL